MASGSQSKFTQEVADIICERIAKGESLRKIGASAEMPDPATVHRWLTKHEQFRAQYALAREQQADFYADECIEIADDKSQDILDIGEGGDKRMITNSAAVQRAKLQVDARRWKAGQLAPKKWGQQSVQTELTGAGGKPLQIIVNVITKALPGPEPVLIEADDGHESNTAEH